MKKCREIEGLIAASCYEELSGEEKALLDSHLAECKACAAESRDMRRFVGAVPVREAAFEGDLLPAIRGELERSAAAGRWWRLVIPPAIITAMLLLALVIGYTMIPLPDRADTAAHVAVLSPVEEALQKADRQLEKRNFTGALQTLGQALSAHPEDADAGEALLRMAGIEFQHLQRYSKACAAYEQLKSEYPETFAENPESIYRLDLLTEARRDKFEALYALERARNAGSDRFGKLEEVVARYPGAMVASLAVDAMGEIVASEMEDGPADRVASLEAVRDRCTEPVAAAQVTIQLGRSWWKDRNDTEKARELYTTVAENTDGRLARLAEEALSELNADTLP